MLPGRGRASNYPSILLGIKQATFFLSQLRDMQITLVKMHEVWVDPGPLKELQEHQQQ